MSASWAFNFRWYEKQNMLSDPSCNQEDEEERKKFQPLIVREQTI
jgi:hypothetical protein